MLWLLDTFFVEPWKRFDMLVQRHKIPFRLHFKPFLFFIIIIFNCILIMISQLLWSVADFILIIHVLRWTNYFWFFDKVFNTIDFTIFKVYTLFFMRNFIRLVAVIVTIHITLALLRLKRLFNYFPFFLVWLNFSLVNTYILWLFYLFYNI